VNQFNRTTRRANHPKVCQAPFRSQYSDFQKSQIGLYLSHPVPLRGAFRERHERGAGMRWTQAARETGVLAGGRPNRVVLTPRRWCQVRATERGRRWPKGPEHRGEHEATVKTIAQGKSDCLRWTCMLVCVFLCKFAHETAGAARIRLSLRPLTGEGGKLLVKPGRHAPRERGGLPCLFRRSKEGRSVHICHLVRCNRDAAG
jgi:hypothetical protein